MNKRKLLEKALAGGKNLRFAELTTLAEAFGFEKTRTQGSHFIYTHPDVQELVNLQNAHGKAKPYQVRQLLELVEQYGLTLEGEEE